MSAHFLLAMIATTHPPPSSSPHRIRCCHHQWVQRGIGDSDSDNTKQMDRNRFEIGVRCLWRYLTWLVGHRMHKLHSFAHTCFIPLSTQNLNSISSLFFVQSTCSLNIFTLLLSLIVDDERRLLTVSTSQQYLQCLNAFHRIKCSVRQRLNIIVVQRQQAQTG